MGALEIFLIVFGIILVAASFIFSEHLLSMDGGNPYDPNIAGVTKEIVQKEVEAEVANVIDEKIEQAEVKLDKITNQKIMALGDYSDDVNVKITKNHDEVMFLYDMLSDKEKTIKNTVRDIEALKASIKHMETEEKKKEVKLTYAIPTEVISENDSMMFQDSVIDRIAKNEEIERAKNQDNKDIIADMTITDTSEILKKSDKAVTQMDIKVEENTSPVNKNKEILSLFSQGKNDVDIAKELGIGVGEVRLVIGLFKTKK
jgi:hypothetical protein